MTNITNHPFALNVKAAPYCATGDGKTDDRPALQKAIDDCYQSGGGTVYMPVGAYLIKEGPLFIKDGVTLLGAGMFHTILKLDADVNTPVITDECATGSKQYAAGRVHLSNFRIDGNKKNNLKGGEGIYTTAYYSSFENLYISNCKLHGLHFGSPKMKNNSSQNRVIGCRIFDCDETGIFLDIKAVDYTVSQNYIYRCNYGLVVKNGGIRIVNNAIFGHRLAAIQVSQTAFGLIIADNDINANSRHGIHITRTRWSDSGPWAQMLIANNIILGDALTADNVYDAILVETTVPNGISQVTIVGNKIFSENKEKRYRYGIHLKNNVVNSKCSNNHVTNIADSTYHVGPTCSSIEIDGLGHHRLDAPVLPASEEALINPYHAPATVYINGGEVSDVLIDGKPTGLTSGSFRLLPSKSIALRYSQAPDWVWVAD